MLFDEKRSAPRKKVRIPVICWESEEEKLKGKGREIITKNFSASGIAFYSSQIYPIGASRQIDIYLPNQRNPVSCRFKVVSLEAVQNKEEYIIGASFEDISSEDRVRIGSVIDKLDLYLLLNSALAGGASDLHLTIGKPPMARRDGRILTMAASVIEPGQVEAMLFPLLNEEQIGFFEQKKELDFAFSPNVSSRFRVNMHKQKGFVEAVLRNIPTSVQSFEQLGLNGETMIRFCQEKGGLFLIAGTTGSGKTTTMAAMVDYINRNYDRVIITLEDPIEYVFKSERSIIKQRELGTDTLSYAEALRRSLRQDPDVICIGEIIDGDCLLAAMRAAETGHMVITTIHAPDTVSAIERAIKLFPPEHTMSLCQELSSCLLGVLFQVLLPGARTGRVLATELLVNTMAMSNLIRENKYAQMGTVLQTGRTFGMYTLDSSLKRLVDKEAITYQDMEKFRKREFK